MEDETPVLKKKIKIDQDSMTLGDLEEFEEITGKSFSDALKRVKRMDPETGKQEVDEKGKPVWDTEMATRGLTAIIFITLRKEDPELTLDAVRNMRLADLDLQGGEENPTESAAESE